MKKVLFVVTLAVSVFAAAAFMPASNRRLFPRRSEKV
jgi:hypothetical protein